MTRRIISWAVWAIITGLYVYMVVAAVGNIVLLPQMVASIGVSITGAGWFWMIFGVALPPLAYALALVFARRSGTAVRLLALATGLCAAAAIQLEVLLLVPQSSFFG
ncbi:hypothetical protein ACXR2T_04320 [Leucobacter sp. HY1910]